MKVRRQFEKVGERNTEGERAVQIKPLTEKQKPHIAVETLRNSQLVVNCSRHKQFSVKPRRSNE